MWSLPGVVNGSRPRREREIVTSVVSKIVTPRISSGASQPGEMTRVVEAQLEAESGHQESRGTSRRRRP